MEDNQRATLAHLNAALVNTTIPAQIDAATTNTTVLLDSKTL